MADDAVLPAIGLTVATDELPGARHVQIVKSLDAVRPVQLLAMLAPASAGGYSAGEIIGEAVLIPDVPTGFYAVQAVSILSLDGSDVPKVVVLAYGNPVDSTPPTLDGDGDTWTFDPSESTGVLAGFASAGDSFSWSGITAATGPLRSATPTVPRVVTKIEDGAAGALADLSITAVALENTAVDLTGGIIVVVTLERVADLADASTFTSF